MDVLLGALGEQLEARRVSLEIVVIGGSALTALGLVRRVTRDVDVLAIADKGELRLAEPLPEALLSARAAVARDFGLDESWLNAGPTELLKWGLPDGLMARVVTRRYGPPWAFTSLGASTRSTSSCSPWSIKEAAVTRRTCALEPTHAELVSAARWSLTQDPSPGYRSVLDEALRYLEVDDADLGD